MRRTLSRATCSRSSPSIFASTCECAPRVFRRASQGPQGRVVPFGGARQGPIVGYVLQPAAPTGVSVERVEKAERACRDGVEALCPLTLVMSIVSRCVEVCRGLRPSLTQTDTRATVAGSLPNRPHPPLSAGRSRRGCSVCWVQPALGSATRCRARGCQCRHLRRGGYQRQAGDLTRL